MNVVPVHAADTLPIIYERGLIGVYHDWCEPFSTYPRSYDLLHADHLFSRLKIRYGIEKTSIALISYNLVWFHTQNRESLSCSGITIFFFWITCFSWITTLLDNKLFITQLSHIWGWGLFMLP
jgi:hypothetical protein